MLRGLMSFALAHEVDVGDRVGGAQLGEVYADQVDHVRRCHEVSSRARTDTDTRKVQVCDVGVAVDALVRQQEIGLDGRSQR